jgi:hypothetical protein
MKLPALAAFSAACFLLPGPAQADWEPTRWGMSAQDVRRVVPAATTAPIGETFRAPGYGDDKNNATFYLYTRIQRENRTYDVRMGFAEDKLRSVEFALIDANEQLCTTARNNLQRRFGTPAGGGAGEGGRFDSWNAPSDSVVFIYRTDPAPRCVILYAPRKGSDSGTQRPLRRLAVVSR